MRCLDRMENEKKQRDAVAVNGEKAKGKPDTEKRVPARILRYDEVYDPPETADKQRN